MILNTSGEHEDMHCSPVMNICCKVLLYNSLCSWQNSIAQRTEKDKLLDTCIPKAS